MNPYTYDDLAKDIAALTPEQRKQPVVVWSPTTSRRAWRSLDWMSPRRMSGRRRDCPSRGRSPSLRLTSRAV